MRQALVIGSAATIDQELGLLDRKWFDSIIGVNAAAIKYGPVDIHATLHPKDYATIKAAYMVSHKKEVGVDEQFDAHHRRGADSSGSSGLFAVRYALDILKADRVILAGVGMTSTPHFNRPHDWHGAKRLRGAWVELAPVLKGRVYSLGGWTAELLNGALPLSLLLGAINERISL